MVRLRAGFETPRLAYYGNADQKVIKIFMLDIAGTQH